MKILVLYRHYEIMKNNSLLIQMELLKISSKFENVGNYEHDLFKYSHVAF